MELGFLSCIGKNMAIFSVCFVEFLPILCYRIYETEETYEIFVSIGNCEEMGIV